MSTNNFLLLVFNLSCTSQNLIKNLLDEENNNTIQYVQESKRSVLLVSFHICNSELQLYFDFFVLSPLHCQPELMSYKGLILMHSIIPRRTLSFWIAAFLFLLSLCVYLWWTGSETWIRIRDICRNTFHYLEIKGLQKLLSECKVHSEQCCPKHLYAVSFSATDLF
jgi:hypothetical protein